MKNPSTLRTFALLACTASAGLLLAPVRASAIGAECFPHSADAAKMPIGAVYLHGLFMPGGTDVNGFRNLEQMNRNQLNALAEKYHVRIALPLGSVGASGWIEWNGLSLGEIEQRAVAACGGAPLASHRVLIGFSNGAQRTGQLCNSATEYSKVLVLGPPSPVASCPRMVLEEPHHVFPYSSVTSAIAGLAAKAQVSMLEEDADEAGSEPTE